uniref:HMG box domain-containing protein n=1 Tax=Leptobrachium leishanense TaxID=445787 RepID=A0A8C5QQ29_9ANUR
MGPKGRERPPLSYSVSRERRLLDMEELAKVIPGGAAPQRDIKSLIVRVLSYIEFLQSRIQDVQDSLTQADSAKVIFYSPIITPRQNKVYGCPQRPRVSRSKECCGAALQSRKKLLVSACREIKHGNPEENAELGVKHAEGWKEHPELDFEETSRQILVPYVSPSSSDNSDASPWLQSVTLSPGTPHSENLPCTPLELSTPSAYLGLSPSLFSSPGDDLHQDESSEVLFEEVQLDSCLSPGLLNSPVMAFTLDHSYQSQSEHNAASAACRYDHQPHYEMTAEVEVGNSTFQPPIKQIERKEARKSIFKKECSPRSGAGGGPMIPHKGQSPGKGHKEKSPGFSRLQRLRKKCVNGFIMFCRLNRKLYLSAHPGTASTAATKELAELWRKMSAQERRPYRVKAYQFSVSHDRMVKKGSSGLLRESLSPPKPAPVLLAEKISSQGGPGQSAHDGRKEEPVPAYNCNSRDTAAVPRDDGSCGSTQYGDPPYGQT